MFLPFCFISFLIQPYARDGEAVELLSPTFLKKGKYRMLLFLKDRLSAPLVLGKYFRLSIHHQWEKRTKSLFIKTLPHIVVG